MIESIPNPRVPHPCAARAGASGTRAARAGASGTRAARAGASGTRAARAGAEPGALQAAGRPFRSAGRMPWRRCVSQLGSGLRRGFTLFELLVTMALMAILLGIGLGALSRPLPESLVAASQIKEAIRRARNFALSEHSPSFLILDPGPSSPPEPGEAAVAPGGVRTVGLWHLEDETLSGFPDAGLAFGGEVVSGGVLGNALQLSGEQVSYVDLGESPSFDAVDGVRMELFVRPEDSGARVLLAKGEAYQLRQLSGGRLEASVLLRTRDDLKRDHGRRLALETDREVLRAGHLSQIIAFYDGWRFEIRVDGLPRAQFIQSKRAVMLPRPDASLLIGDPEQPFAGLVDEVRLGVVVLENDRPLPHTVRVVGPRTVVYFDSDGRLDPRFHDRPVTLAFEWGSPAHQRVLEVGLMGEMR